LGLQNPTIVKRDNNGKIERLESIGLDIAGLVAFWRRCFDLSGLLFEKITLHCKLKDFNAMGQRTLATCCSVRELLAEQGVKCVIDDEWFKNHEVKNEEKLEAEIERVKAEIERVKADNEALTMWDNASAETIQKLSETNKRLASNMKSVLEIEKKNAVKEFAEKLKKQIANTMYCRDGYVDYDDTIDVIDELLKEYEK
jgi:hypothetical protein